MDARSSSIRIPVIALVLLASAAAGAPSAHADEPCAAEQRALDEVSAKRAALKARFLGKRPDAPGVVEARAEYARVNEGSGAIARELEACQRSTREAAEVAKRAQRAARERAVAEKAALVASRRGDKAWMQAPLSALVCEYTRERAAALTEIQHLKKYAQVSGTIDLVEMHGWQPAVRAFDEKLVVIRGRLKELKVKALACGSLTVKATLACQRAAAAACDDARISAYADLAAAEQLAD